MSDIEIYSSGQWVEFKVAAFIEPGNIILPEMLGVVVDTPYSHYVCTPGVSTMINVAGADFEYGYGNEWFDPIEGAPSDEELTEQLKYWDHAFEIYEDNFGYTGYVKVGQKVLPQEKLYQEMTQTLNRMQDWLKQEEGEKHIKGNLKRMKKILSGFHKHPEGNHARLLSAKIQNSTVEPDVYPDLIKYIEDWVTVVQNTDQRIEPQSDRITQAKKEGRSKTIPFTSREEED